MNTYILRGMDTTRAEEAYDVADAMLEAREK